MASMPHSIHCPCGAEAVRALDGRFFSFAKNTDYEFKMAKNEMSNAAWFGRSDREEHEVYQQEFSDLRRMKRESKLSGKKGGMQWLGSMPGVMVDSISKHEGDPTIVQKDPVTFLKKTGLYEGD